MKSYFDNKKTIAIFKTFSVKQLDRPLGIMGDHLKVHLETVVLHTEI